MAMATRIHPVVTDAAGARGTIRELSIEGAHPARASVELEDGSLVEVPTETLHRHPDGGYTIDAQWQSFARQGTTTTVIPVIEETVTTRKQERIRDRVRVRRRVVSEERVVETPLVRDRLDVERVPIGTFVDSRPESRQDGDTLIIPCVEEVVVVEKRLRLVEELRIRIVREQVVDRQTVVVRRHEVDVLRDTEPGANDPSRSPNRDKDQEEP
jgi:stress response protein YsnF